MRHQRKPAKVRVGKTNVPVPDIPLQEPILITDVGKILFPLAPCREYISVLSTQWQTDGYGETVLACCSQSVCGALLLYGPVCSTVKLKILALSELLPKLCSWLRKKGCVQLEILARKSSLKTNFCLSGTVNVDEGSSCEMRNPLCYFHLKIPT